MKRWRWRKLKNNTDASLTSYVMVLLGMTIMLYLFGFSSMWDIYTGTDEGGVILTEGQTTGEDTDDVDYNETKAEITDPELNIGTKLFKMLTNSIYSVMVGSAAIGGTLIFLWFFRKNQAMWQYIIPILLMVVLNVFVFPISALQGDMSSFDASFKDYIGFSFTLLLIVFFNLFYILAVLEFIRGGGST